MRGPGQKIARHTGIVRRETGSRTTFGPHVGQARLGLVLAVRSRAVSAPSQASTVLRVNCAYFPESVSLRGRNVAGPMLEQALAALFSLRGAGCVQRLLLNGSKQTQEDYATSSESNPL